MQESSNDMGLVADDAITQLGVHAKALERVTRRLPDSADRSELVWLVESLRDQEQMMRDRIGAMARRVK